MFLLHIIVTIESGTNNSFQEINEDGNLDFTVKEGTYMESVLLFQSPFR